MFYVISMDANNGGEAREVVFVLETEYPDLPTLAHALRQDGFVGGQRYNTRFGVGGRREVRGTPHECLIFKNVIRQVAVLTQALFDTDGTKLFDPAAGVCHAG